MGVARPSVAGVLVLAVLLSAGHSVRAQVSNPHEGNPEAIRAGRSLYEARCTECHGADARGMSGPDLTALWGFGTRDERVFRTIREGVSGSIMPSSDAPDDEIWAIVAYLKSISTVAFDGSMPGDAGHGREVFEATCTACHRVDGRGGRLGPDLSRIGQTRSRDALILAIRDPGASVAAGYRPVTLTTADGRRVRGINKGEDAFSIQVIDTDERLQGYRKADLKDLTHDDQSLMPVFGPDRLDDVDLDDLIKFLSTLRQEESTQP